MSSTLIKSVLFLFLPFILPQSIRLIKALFNWRQYCSLGRKLNWFEIFGFVTSIIWLVFLYASAFHTKPLYFALTNTQLDSPSYMIRNKFREFSQKLLSENPKTQLAMEKSQNGESMDDHLTKIWTEYRYIEDLSNHLRSNDNRKIYVLFGDTTSCLFCEKTSWLLGLFIAPEIALMYVGTFVAIGVLTSSQKKRRLRVPSMICITLFLLYELYIWSYSEEFVTEFYSMIDAGTNYTRPEQLQRIRSIFLVAIVSLVMLLDLDKPRNQLLENLLATYKSLEASAAKLYCSRLAKIVISNDTLLAKTFSDSPFTRDLDQHDASSPEAKIMRSDLSRKYNVESLINRALES